MKRALLMLSLAALVLPASAQTKKKPAEPKILECPVMKGNKVDIAKATKEKMFADHKGRRYFFCCGSCPPAFKKNPDRFADKKNSIATPKPPKKKKP